MHKIYLATYNLHATLHFLQYTSSYKFCLVIFYSVTHLLSPKAYFRFVFHSSQPSSSNVMNLYSGIAAVTCLLWAASILFIHLSSKVQSSHGDSLPAWLASYPTRNFIKVTENYTCYANGHIQRNILLLIKYMRPSENSQQCLLNFKTH